MTPARRPAAPTSPTGVAALGAIVMLGVLALAGCTAQGPADRLSGAVDWLGGLDGVDSATVTGDPDDPTLVVELEPDLPPDGVRAVAEAIEDLDEHGGDRYHSGVDLVVGDFATDVYPDGSTGPEPDLERVLWAIEDGRATASYSTESGGLVVVAPPGQVGAVALGVIDAAPPTEVRLTHRVESPDRRTQVVWSESPGVGATLDRSAVEAFARLQETMPGTRGWLSFPDDARAVVFSPDDVPLTDLLADVEALVDGVGRTAVGWGPGLASSPDCFTGAFGEGRDRRLLQDLALAPGVRRLGAIAGCGPVERVWADDGDGLRAAAAAIRDADRYVGLAVVRGPDVYPGRLPREAIETSNRDTRATFDRLARLADLPLVTDAFIADDPPGPESAPLEATVSVHPDVDDATLRSALRVMAGLPDTYRATVRVGSEDTAWLGEAVVLAPGGDATDGAQATSIDPALLERIRAAWAALAR